MCCHFSLMVLAVDMGGGAQNLYLGETMADSASPCRFMLVRTSHLASPKAWRFEAIVSLSHRRVQSHPTLPVPRREVCLGGGGRRLLSNPWSRRVGACGLPTKRGDRDAFTLQSGAARPGRPAALVLYASRRSATCIEIRCLGSITGMLTTLEKPHPPSRANPSPATTHLDLSYKKDPKRAGEHISHASEPFLRLASHTHTHRRSEARGPVPGFTICHRICALQRGMRLLLTTKERRGTPLLSLRPPPPSTNQRGAFFTPDSPPRRYGYTHRPPRSS